MGSGSWSRSAFCDYSYSVGKTYSTATGRVSGQSFSRIRIHENLEVDAKTIRECCNTDEHPNTVPVILALDVTGSMGEACRETAEALGQLMESLYERYKDIEVCVMGIGDVECDSSPIQMSQFESDIRIAKEIDKIYMEHGGGGNAYESYTAAWYMGLYHTKLDAYDKQGRKGIIITMGDEELNPILTKSGLNSCLNETLQDSVSTDELYVAASKKFDIYHINVEHGRHSLTGKLEKSWVNTLGQDNFTSCSVNGIKDAIVEFIDKSIENKNAGIIMEDNKPVVEHEATDVQVIKW